MNAQHTPGPHDRTVFESGMKHYREGVPRACNPCYVAVVNSGARKPMQHKAVIAWWAGWDVAKAADDAQPSEASALLNPSRRIVPPGPTGSAS